MYLIPFGAVFPEQAAAETRVLYIRGYPPLPDNQYAIVEFYCVEPGCDCRRVMLNILTPDRRAFHASVSFGFDREGELAGPFLDPLNPQGPHAALLLELVRAQLETDAAYVRRLEAHYAQTKAAAADPKHPKRALLAASAWDRPQRPAPPPAKPARKRKRR